LHCSVLPIRWDGVSVLPLVCQDCGTTAFRLRQAAADSDAQCLKCGAIVPNAALQSADLDRAQRAALEMIHLHGRDAARQAARRAGDALAKGNVEETGLWLAVIGMLVG
jgi:hypothetical protein